MRFVIVTGMSGGGKRTALKMLEDMGFFCVDNLPVPLIEKFAELITAPKGEINKVALGLDVRADQSLTDVHEVLKNLRREGCRFEVLFMDADDDILIRRYKESRRMHPLATGEGASVEDGIRRERELLSGIKKEAEYVIDTSRLLTRQLQEEMERIFIKNEDYRSLMLNIVSFGFKNGIPAEADLVFDVRFLPNPFYLEELKGMTGNDRAVRDYVMQFPEADAFLDRLTELLRFLLPYYIKEGKHRLVVGIGCTGGRHRSVTLANKLYRRLDDGQRSFGLTVSHRDAG